MSLKKFKFNNQYLFYSSVSNLLRFGPATKPTSPKSTKEPIPTPAAQGLKPPMANEANKFMNFLNTLILVLAYRIIEVNIPKLRHFFVIEENLIFG